MFLLSACNTAKKTDNLTLQDTNRGVSILAQDSFFFDSGKAEIKKEAGRFLDEVAELISQQESCTILVEGHTDNVGGSELNNELSELRALVVMKELIDRGVSKDRIRYKGYGMSRPIADNGTPEGRASNRRTEIILVGKTKTEIKSEFYNSLKTLFDF